MSRVRLSAVCLAFLLIPAWACGPSDTEGDDDGVDASLPPQPDEDGDGISDADEDRAGGSDTDSDGTPDYLDDDSDGDGVPDFREAGDADTNTQPVDSDSDGTPDFRDTDSDANGILDGDDGTNDLDQDGRPDFQDLDDDGDNLGDALEIGANAAAPLDSDGDTLPDYRDVDSDNDTIMDLHELQTDPDQDLIPAYLDTDADGDCRPDSIEAGDSNLMTPPVDTDMDGGPDFVDVDADNDGLLDQLEDVNCNGTLDMGESSAQSEDTDMDGVSDLIEVAAGTNPQDMNDNPQSHGDFVFIVPYVMPPNPMEDTLDFATNITQADVVFAMDTTGSMAGEITNLRNSLTGTIIPNLKVEIPNVAIAVGSYDDFPTSTYGSPGDQPWELRHRVMTVTTSAGIASVQGAVNVLGASGGNDTPESGWEAVFQIATGGGTTQGAANVPAFNAGTAPPASIPAGESVGTIGGVGFRAGSLPIVVVITDAPSHNGSTGNNYSGFTAASFNQAIAALNGLGGRLIGVVSAGGDPSFGNQPTQDLTNGVAGTMSLVPPSAWDLPGGGRPAGCAAGLCCTGTNGAGVPPVGATCPLVFAVDSGGSGLGNTVVQAIKVLTTFIKIDIGATPVDDPTDAVDAVASFVDHIEANAAAGAPCATGLVVVDTNGDTFADTFQQVLPGTQVCFDVFPKMNTTVMPTTQPQMFKATIQVIGDGVTTLDTRDVYFLVPPEIPDPPIM